MRPPEEHPDRIPALDGIRGIAILTVLVFHFAELPQAIQNSLSPASRALFQALRVGWLGVDIFFVLSGFLITAILLRSRNQSGYYRRFYWRRSLRILPVYYGTLTVLALLFWVRPPHSADMAAAANHQIWLWLFLANVALSFSIPLTLPHFWSLAVEEHFYLFWPWVVRQSQRRFLHVCIVVISSVWLCRVVGAWFLPTSALYLLTPFRMDALAAGAMLAMLVQQGQLGRLVPFARIAAPVAIMVFALLHYRFSFSRPDGVGQAVLGYTAVDLTAFCMIVMALAKPQKSLYRRLLELRPLRSYGKYSYAIYAFHVPLHAALWGIYSRLTVPARLFMDRHVLANVLVFVIFASAMCWLVGYCSWNLFEKHLLKYKDALDSRPVPAPQALAATAAD